jgi:gas vesicle protein
MSSITEETMTTLSDNQKKFYEDALNQTKGEIQELENQIQEELAAVKQKIADLQAAQKAARQMYDAACMRLGIPNDLEEESSQG